MKNLHRNRLLDEARVELGTEVQFFELDFDTIITWICVLAFVVMVLFFLTTVSSTILLTAFFSSAATMFMFYIKFGTN